VTEARRTHPIPEIVVADFVAGAREARGLVVVIDVFRAFSVACYAYAQGAARIIPVASIEQARDLRASIPDSLLIGERHARPLPGFDAGNSPTELERLDLHGRTLIHTTHAGTQGLTQAVRADEVITGALVNASAIVRYVGIRRPERVTLVRMGQDASERCAEDDLCAEILRRRLGGLEPDVADISSQLRSAPSAMKFFDPAATWAPERDFALCTRADAFDFVLQLQTAEAVPSLKAIPVSPASRP
jgi:2-phosphosulfolactate phosphatase